MRELLTDRRVRLIGLGVLALLTAALVIAAILRSPSPAVVATPVTASPTTSADAAPTAAPSPDTATISPTTTPSEQGVTAVFLGDRYTAGAQWPDQAGEAGGWQVVNLGQAGQGYRVAPKTCAVQPCTPFKGMVAQVVERNPDVLVIAGGEADGDYDLAAFVEPTLTAFREALPDAEILVMPPLSAESPQPYWLRLHTQTLREAASDASVTFVDVSAVTSVSASYANGSLTTEAGQRLANLVSTGGE